MPVSNDELVEAILRPIDKAFKSQGITPVFLAKRHKDLMNSEDERNKLAALKEAYQVLGHYPATKHKVDGIPEKINVTFTEDFGTKDK